MPGFASKIDWTSCLVSSKDKIDFSNFVLFSFLFTFLPLLSFHNLEYFTLAYPRKSRQILWLTVVTVPAKPAQKSNRPLKHPPQDPSNYDAKENDYERGRRSRGFWMTPGFHWITQFASGLPLHLTETGPWALLHVAKRPHAWRQQSSSNSDMICVEPFWERNDNLHQIMVLHFQYRC